MEIEISYGFIITMFVIMTILSFILTAIFLHYIIINENKSKNKTIKYSLLYITQFVIMLIIMNNLDQDFEIFTINQNETYEVIDKYEIKEIGKNSEKYIIDNNIEHSYNNDNSQESLKGIISPESNRSEDKSNPRFEMTVIKENNKEEKLTFDHEDDINFYEIPKSKPHIEIKSNNSDKEVKIGIFKITDKNQYQYDVYLP